MEERENFKRPGPVGRLVDGLAQAEFGLAMVLMAAMVVVNLLEIVARSFFAHSFSWIQDVTVLLAAWMIFLGFVGVAAHGRDIAVTFLVERMAPRLRLAAHLFISASSVAFLGVLSVAAYQLIGVQQGQVSLIAKLPLTLYTWPLLVCSATLLLVELYDAVMDLVALFTGKNHVRKGVLG